VNHFQRRCELEALVTEREAIAVLHRHDPNESTHEQLLSLASRIRDLSEPGKEQDQQPNLAVLLDAATYAVDWFRDVPMCHLRNALSMAAHRLENGR
jgi:hypothetical protein